jgi:hypothetical protein
VGIFRLLKFTDYLLVANLLKVNWEILKLGDFEISQFQNFPILRGLCRFLGLVFRVAASLLGSIFMDNQRSYGQGVEVCDATDGQ